MSKIQNLKAIHNNQLRQSRAAAVVSDVKDTKFESNSQLSMPSTILFIVVSDVKDTKFESNSQLDGLKWLWNNSCFRCQRYKI